MTRPAAMLDQRQQRAAATLIRPTTAQDQPAANQRTSVGDQKLIGNSPVRHWLVTLNKGPTGRGKTGLAAALQETINPHVAAMLDAERSELRDELTAVAIFIVGACAAPILAALRWSSAADTLRKRKYHAPFTSTDLARVPKDAASAQQARSPSGVHE